MLLIMPLLYLVLDKPHFMRALKSSFHFDRNDITWLKEFGRYMKKPGRNSLPSWHEFNTYHKFWFSYLAAMIFVLGVSGVVKLFFRENAGIFDSIHVLFALTLDLLVLTHLYFKIIRRVHRDSVDLIKCFRQSGQLNFPFRYDPRSNKTD
jgi:cytochrome b subunit of formate dehydrogenase